MAKINWIYHSRLLNTIEQIEDVPIEDMKTPVTNKRKGPENGESKKKTKKSAAARSHEEATEILRKKADELQEAKLGFIALRAL